jgi:hypothetical protein
MEKNKMKKNVLSAVFLLALLSFSMVGGVLGTSIKEENGIYAVLAPKTQNAKPGETVEYTLILRDVHEIYRCNLEDSTKCYTSYNYNIVVDSELEVEYDRTISLQAGETKMLKVYVTIPLDGSANPTYGFAIPTDSGLNAHNFVIKVSEEGNKFNTATVQGVLIDSSNEDSNPWNNNWIGKPYFYSGKTYRPKILGFIPNPFAKKVTEIRAVNGSEFRTFKIREGEQVRMYGYNVFAKRFAEGKVELQIEGD